MQKRILAGLPILAAALIFLGLWIVEQLSAPPWQSDLNQYIAYQASSSDSPITTQQTIQARRPWKFSANMSAGTFGDCINYQTNLCYSQDKYSPSPLLLFTPEGVMDQTDISNNQNERFTSAPLIFPPEEVRCVLVTQTSSGEKTDWVIYIAKHQDLYNADWIVHESSKSIADPQLKNDLASIGCENLLTTGK